MYHRTTETLLNIICFQAQRTFAEPAFIFSPKGAKIKDNRRKTAVIFIRAAVLLCLLFVFQLISSVRLVGYSEDVF